MLETFDRFDKHEPTFYFSSTSFDDQAYAFECYTKNRTTFFKKPEYAIEIDIPYANEIGVSINILLN